MYLDDNAELNGDDIATTDWAALVTALRRVLAGDRGREFLLAGLDDIGTATRASYGTVVLSTPVTLLVNLTTR